MDIQLDQREQAHIKFCILYKEQFNHGSPDHLSMIIIAKLAQTVAALQNDIALLKLETNPEFMD